MSIASDTGLPLPGWVILPSTSIEPEVSTTWISASACPMAERNWFPSPRPFQASLTNPGTSTSFMGIYRQPSMHAEFNGLSFNPNSLQTHMSQTYAVPMLGFFVVNGKLEIFAFRRVAALNKVVFPVFVLPIMAMVGKQNNPQLNNR